MHIKSGGVKKCSPTSRWRISLFVDSMMQVQEIQTNVKGPWAWGLWRARSDS